MNKLKVNFSLKTYNFINAFLVENKQTKITTKNLNLFISIADSTVLLSVQESISVCEKTVQEGF